MKKSYQKLRSNIPSEIVLSRKYKFRVIWSDDVGKSKNGRPHYGQTSFDQGDMKIEIYKNLADEAAVKTYWHEFLHTFRLYKDMHLTEKQVKSFEQKFEVFYQFFLTLHDGSSKINDEED